ncbi:hypothetical protein MRX96_033133 [Rhipicephalus microplus]
MTSPGRGVTGQHSGPKNRGRRGDRPGRASLPRAAAFCSNGPLKGGRFSSGSSGSGHGRVSGAKGGGVCAAIYPTPHPFPVRALLFEMLSCLLRSCWQTGPAFAAAKFTLST